jgi:hypothetical protein
VTDLTLVQECEGPDGETLLCWLPNKFSKVVWAQRGDFLIVAPQSPDEGNTKISATISHILFPEQVLPLSLSSPSPPPSTSSSRPRPSTLNPNHSQADHLRPMACWPERWAKAADVEDRPAVERDGEDGSGSEGDDDDLFQNTNGMQEDSYEESEEEEEEEEEEEDV